LQNEGGVVKRGALVLLHLPLLGVIAAACGTSGGGSQSSSSTSGGSASSSGGSGSTSSGGSTGGSGGSTGSSGGTSGSSSGAPSSSTSGSASDGGDLDGSLPEGSANKVPAGYTGTPFKALTIPGTIYLADYDTGGPGVAFCHAPGATGAACGNGIKNPPDWCCTGRGCDQQAPVCPPYRTGTDNAGLSHMNTAEPDDTPSGMPVSPYFPYLSYSVTGEWFKYTVQVLEAGTYSISGLMAAPRPPQNQAPTVSLDFGGGVTTGTFTVPSSLCGNPDPGCTEGYHVWQMDNDLATVMIPAAGTYVMTFTLVSSFLNPGYVTFTKV
jgi:hypothetical protein